METTERRRKALQTAKKPISSYLATARPGYSLRELQQILAEEGHGWGLVGVPFTVFLNFLLEEGKLRKLVLKTESYGSEVRYVWGKPTPHQVAISLRKHAYLSHGTAVALHGLTDQIPKTIYVNAEQTAKPAPQSASLSQERLDLAFRRPQRISNYVFLHEGHRIVLLSGKQTGDLEVAWMKEAGVGEVRVTKLERTLIDIVVRPAYAGGVVQVLEAYQNALGKLSLSVLLATLKQLAYVYPYHQAIGFLLERAGGKEIDLSRLRELGLQHDFYLVHGMKETDYNPKWRLFIPEGF